MGSYFAYYLTGFIMIPVFIFATYCQIKVKRSFSTYSQLSNRRRMTGAQAAYELLQLNGINDVKIKKISGTLTDYYDPKNKEICLSQDVFDSTSVAAVGVACHEAGHACQHAPGICTFETQKCCYSYDSHRFIFRCSFSVNRYVFIQ